MTERTGASWLVYALGALCAGAIVAAILVVGPASGSQPTATRTATAARGVVQSTVSGSGNLQAASQLNLGFKTAGTVASIDVTQGEHVTAGQLIATLDPQSAEVALEQSKAALQSAQANLASEEESGGAGSSGQGSGGSTGAAGSGGSSGASAAIASAASHASLTSADATGAVTAAVAPASAPSAERPSTTTPAQTPAPGTTRKSTTTPSSSTPSTPSTGKSKASGGETTAGTHEGSSAGTSSSSSSSSSSSVSQATREANLASARASVRSDELTVQSDEQAVENTRLYAPETGTIASLSGQVGEVVSGSGTTRSSSSASSSSGSGSSASSGAGASSSARAGGAGSSGASGSSASSGSSSSSSTPFAVLSDLSSMQLVVALSESEIGSVRSGQVATVTIEALGGRKVAAHVAEVAILSSSSSGVVSYDVTFQLDQLEAGMKPGMSATAEVVVKQAEGINVPTSAITAASVTVLHDGKQTRRRVVTGLAGNSSTIILSGLRAGEVVVLPSASGSGASITSRLGSRLGKGGLGGASLGGAGGGGGLPAGAFFRGGG